MGSPERNGGGGNKEEHSWRETGGGCENRVSETSSLTKLRTLGAEGTLNI